MAVAYFFEPSQTPQSVSQEWGVWELDQREKLYLWVGGDLFYEIPSNWLLGYQLPALLWNCLKMQMLFGTFITGSCAGRNKEIYFCENSFFVGTLNFEIY